MATNPSTSTNTQVGPVYSNGSNGNGTGKPRDLKWMVLLTVVIGTFLGRLDQTIVNLAIPKVINDFSITVSAAAWIVTAYIIANAIFVPIWGKLGDTVGRKKIYILGFSIFIGGSILAGLSWNLGSMIVFRVIQAIASSADYPTAMAIIAITFREPKERAQALGIWSSSFASASVFGPLIGGPLIDIFGWRSVFLVNLPVGLLGLFMALAYVHESKSEQGTINFDWWGATTLGGALAFLVMILDQGMGWGWNSGTSWLCYGAIVVFSALFVWIERRHPEPIVDFSFFRNRTFNGALLNNFIVFLGMMGSVFAIPIFAQTFLGYDATQSGLLFIPMGLCIPISAIVLGRTLLAKFPARSVIFWGTLGAAVSFYFLSWIDPRSGAWAIIWPLSLMALFMGSGMAQRTNLIAAAVPPSEIGVASSILALVRNIGGAVGIAVFGTLIQTFTEKNVIAISQNSIINATTPSEHATAVALISLKAQVLAYSDVYIIAAVVVGLGAFAIFMVKKTGPGERVELSKEQEAAMEAG